MFLNMLQKINVFIFPDNNLKNIFSEYRFEKSMKSTLLRRIHIEIKPLGLWLNKSFWLYCNSVRSELAFITDKWLVLMNEVTKS